MECHRDSSGLTQEAGLSIMVRNTIRGMVWPVVILRRNLGNLWRQMRLIMISAPRLHPGVLITGPLPELGKSVSIGHHCVLMTAANQRISIGEGTKLNPYVFLNATAGPITIGRMCSINPFSCLYGQGPLHIGDHVLMASHVRIVPSMHVFADPSRTIREQGVTRQGITIGDDVWLGTGAVVLDGVEIGKGAVVAAGAVVRDSVEPYTVVGGMPARPLKRRCKR